MEVTRVAVTNERPHAILGSPQSCDEALGFRSCQWGDEKSYVTARFIADKLVLFAVKNIH